MRNQFLLGAEVVLSAISDERVAERWNDHSILAEQTIGSLSSHLARSGAFAVLEYLDAETSERNVDFETAAAYYAEITPTLTEDAHRAIRDRSAAIAAAGHASVVEQLSAGIVSLRERLPAEPADRTVAVFAGKVMRLDDYLWTRVVEQVVHLDDLACSLGIEPWPNPPDAAALVVACGAEIGRLKSGDVAMIRALFGRDARLSASSAAPLPVI
jgi:hypothetical protein